METQPSICGTPHVHFRPTTASQRHLLFNTVAETGSVSEGARRAHTGRGTYYYWQSRVEAGGLAALDSERSRAPHHTRIPPVSAALRQEVLDYDQQHPTAGYRTIANDLAKAHAWQPVISYDKVGEIVRPLRAARTACVTAKAPTVAPTPAVVHAPRPNETVNIDLCVVPATYTDPTAWVSVSVSQAAERVALEQPGPTPAGAWPGQVFANPALAYEQQMQSYVEQRTAQRRSRGQRKHQRRAKQAARAELNAHRDELRLARRRRRLARRQEDALWKVQSRTHRESERTWKSLPVPERRLHRPARRVQQTQWQTDKARRRAQQHQRAVEDAAWQQDRRTLRNQLALLANQVPVATAWLAILVVVCNGTRRCLGLPFFTAGAHVTADMIVAALRGLCPAELEFIISDNGTQFIADAFAQLVKEQDLVHVRIAPRRPCTNGIAERFVRTLKEWLASQQWDTPEAFAVLLKEFIVYYNDRPHQGAELGGLSPNEFAHRLATVQDVR